MSVAFWILSGLYACSTVLQSVWMHCVQVQLSEAADYERQVMDPRYDMQNPEALSLPARWDSNSRMQADAQSSQPWWEVSFQALIVLMHQSQVFVCFGMYVKVPHPRC